MPDLEGGVYFNRTNNNRLFSLHLLVFVTSSSFITGSKFWAAGTDHGAPNHRCFVDFKDSQPNL